MVLEGGSEVGGPGVFEVVGGSHVVAIAGPSVAVENLTLTSGLLQVDGQLDVGGVFQWNGGTLTGSGITNLEAGGVMTIADGSFGATHTVQGAGIVDWVGTADFVSGTNLTLLADVHMHGTAGGSLNGSQLTFGGTTTLDTTGQLKLYRGGTLTNAGTWVVRQDFLLVGAGSGIKTFRNAGTVQMEAGTLVTLGIHEVVLEGGSAVVGPGVFDVRGGGSYVIVIAGPSVAVENLTLGVRLTANHDWNVTGDLLLSGGTLTGNSDTILAPGAVLRPDGGAFLGDHIVRGAGTVEIAAGSTVSGTGTILTDVNIADGGFRLDGTLSLGGDTSLPGSGSIGMYGGSTLNVLPEGTLTIENLTSINRVGFGGSAAFHNAGTFVKTGSATLVTTNLIQFEQAGSLELLAGEIDIQAPANQASVVLDGNDYFVSRPGTTLTLRGSITGNTQAASDFSPQGRLRLAGGAATVPQWLEVMGRDRGLVPAGFVDNFAYGQIEVAGYTQLIDEADNAIADANPEVLYVDGLTVNAGATLDLNGLQVYARAVINNGTILGGNVQVLGSGGPIERDTPTSAKLAASGLVDEWTFFGRAGQAVTILADPGGDGMPPPLDPVLGQVHVELVAPDGTTVLASRRVDGRWRDRHARQRRPARRRRLPGSCLSRLGNPRRHRQLRAHRRQRHARFPAAGAQSTGDRHARKSLQP